MAPAERGGRFPPQRSSVKPSAGANCQRQATGLGGALESQGLFWLPLCQEWLGGAVEGPGGLLWPLNHAAFLGGRLYGRKAE